ncbi:uridine phosphorylase, putative [Eimeria tenella]|uniref:Uridine phosphorylase, putative n=1 Tax=Eimeria tenella TaxID=5802 RepID=U6KPX1_EIMTE|nr:uridine phosphorylase, putative [Eimeria tenella]CDJ37493.1 uridine phosphorylase, putative [Eimeria tenella]|eukprot:XP_013228331.1 uridine phosphorylase, putative [Eimeria tenella]
MAEKEAEIFLNEDGSLYHLGVKSGELHPRILTVGDRERAQMIAEAFLEQVREFEKSRNFRTFSGLYKGRGVSVVCIGMGAPNMDFLVRESSFLFQQKGLAFVRLGTCGIFKAGCSPGTLCISNSIYYCQRNYAHFDGSAAGAPGVHTPEGPYLISGPVKGDEELLNKIEENVKRKNLAYLRGLGITAETFYSCQGRRFPGFGDENEKLVEDFVRLGIDSCEMESHQLYHLCSEREKERKRKENEKEMKEKETKDNSNSESKQGPTRAASICLGVVNRVDPSAPSQLIRKSEDCTKEILLGAAEAALDALISVSI